MFATKVEVELSSPVGEYEVGAMCDHLCEGMLMASTQKGLNLLAHLKGIVVSGSSGSMRFNQTNPLQEVSIISDWKGSADRFTVWINMLAFGPSEEDLKSSCISAIDNVLYAMPLTRREYHHMKEATERPITIQ